MKSQAQNVMQASLSMLPHKFQNLKAYLWKVIRDIHNFSTQFQIAHHNNIIKQTNEWNI